MNKFFFFCLLPVLLSCTKESESENLNTTLSEEWTISGSNNIQIYQNHLSSVYPALIQEGLIEHPFYGVNERKSSWVENEKWIYTHSFDIEDTSAFYDLVFKGLDTYASVYLNNMQLGTSNNMHRTWVFPIHKYIKAGSNELKLVFYPIKPINDSLYKELKVKLPYDSRVMSRKAAFHYGWDWGPELITVGMFRPPVLRKWKSMKINDFQIYQTMLSDSAARLKFSIQIAAEFEKTIRIRITENGKTIRSKRIKLEKGLNAIELYYLLENPDLWWPNAYGKQHLYTYELELLEGSKRIEQSQKRIGIRTVELIQEKDQHGSSFYFKVNGKAIFAKGANYVPADVFADQLSRARYQKLICDAKAMNFNMLRVWGGGIYESDDFYELCDENGIMVWQDFMFACALYPGNTEFLENVAQEAKDQVRRLRNHPSIVLWCGNNEIEEAWQHWGIQKQFNYSHEDSSAIWNSYKALFHKLLPSVLNDLDPDRPYYSSSPKYGWGNPESMKSADSHYWGVWWGEEPFETYLKKTGRFMSEYGFQSFPQWSSIQQYIPEEEQQLTSPSFKVHQKHPRGAELIDLYMKRDFIRPDNIEDYVYVSNLVQAYGIGMAIESHRRSKPYCMGTLYWQFNDCWPVTSWSSIDYYGQWKALHYKLNILYDDVLISPIRKNDSLLVYIVSDRLEGFKAELNASCLDFEGKQFFAKQLNVQVKANSSELLMAIPLNEMDIDTSAAFFHFNLLENSQELVKANYLLCSPKHVNLPEKRPQITVHQRNDSSIIHIFSEVFLKDFYIENFSPDDFISDNYIDLLPGETKKLVFHSKKEKLNNETLKFKALNFVQ